MSVTVHSENVENYPSNVVRSMEGESNLNGSIKNEDKLRIESSTFRSWSTMVEKADKSSNSPIYTLKCIFGDPNGNHSSATFLKSANKSILQNVLQKRGLSTVGSKKQLLRRYQTQLPFVTMDIDGRECLQRVVTAMLHYFEWDNSHLFECKVPRRGDYLDGIEYLDSILCLEVALFERLGPTMDSLTRRHIELKLEKEGFTWSDLQRTIKDPENAIGPCRRLVGAGFTHYLEGWNSALDGDFGGHLSLLELEVAAGDSIVVNYDFGRPTKFTIQVLGVKAFEPILSEVELGQEHHLTRAKLVESGHGHLPPQYES